MRDKRSYITLALLLASGLLLHNSGSDELQPVPQQHSPPPTVAREYEKQPAPCATPQALLDYGKLGDGWGDPKTSPAPVTIPVDPSPAPAGSSAALAAPTGGIVLKHAGEVLQPEPVRIELPDTSFQDQSVMIEVEEGRQRIGNEIGITTSGGSGTYFYDNGIKGGVVTCSHLWSNTNSPTFVIFRNGIRRAAKIISIDKNKELAFLIVDSVDLLPARLATEKHLGDFTATGFGTKKVYQQTIGPIVGRDRWRGATTDSVVINADGEQGDSGGGVYNNDAELAGVRWGCVEKQTRFVPVIGNEAVFKEAIRQIDNATPNAVKLVVLSLPDGQCPPCMKLRPVIEQLEKDGYDAKDYDLNDYTGPDKAKAARFPTLLFYNEKNELVLHTQGFYDREQLLQKLRKP